MFQAKSRQYELANHGPIRLLFCRDTLAYYIICIHGEWKRAQNAQIKVCAKPWLVSSLPERSFNTQIPSQLSLLILK